MLIESWMTTHQYLQFQLGSDSVKLKYFSTNEQWDLVGTSQRYEAKVWTTADRAYDHVEFTLVIRRKVLYYTMNVIIPSILIAIAHMSSMLLGIGEIEKITISFSCLLAFSMFQLMVNGDMPRSSDHIPVLSIYIDLQMTFITLSLVSY